MHHYKNNNSLIFEKLLTFYMNGLIEQWGNVSSGAITFNIKYIKSYSITMNSFGISYTGGGSSFDAIEGRCMSCNLTSMIQEGCTFDYGERDIGTAYTVLWQTKGY